jgi:hypothetical protein
VPGPTTQMRVESAPAGLCAERTPWSFADTP